MNKLLVVVDMQNDFIGGALGNEECRAVVPHVVDKIKAFDGDFIVYTLDTHHKDYLETQEGKKLPVEHCIEYSQGWMLVDEVDKALPRGTKVAAIRKNTFGSVDLIRYLQERFDSSATFEIEFVGVCTGICVISNAMLVKAFFTEATVNVDASCCACVTQESHKTALSAMKLCQINVINE